MLMIPNNMIITLLLNMPFKNHLPMTLIYNHSHCLCIQLFVHHVVNFLPTSDKRFRKVKIGHYCSTILFKQFGLVSDMDKESREQTSKTLFHARVCNTSTAAATLFILHIYFW